MVGREVIGTIPVRRHVLLVAEAAVAEGSWLVGRSTADVFEEGVVRPLGMIDHRTGATVLARDWARPLEVGDRLVVVASRAGLSWILGTSDVASVTEGNAR